MCAECHTTDFKKGYDPAADTYRSSWSELDVGCQACHGPGADHLAWARKGGRGAAERARGRLQGGRPALRSGRLRDLPLAAEPHRGRRAPGAAALRHAETRVAAGRALPRRRPAARRGLRVRVLPAKQDVRSRRSLHRLPQPAQRQDQGRGQRALHPVPQAGGQSALPDARAQGLRLAVASFSQGGLAGRSVRQLPHAHQGLHDRGSAAGPHPAPAAPGSLGQDRDAQRVHGLPPEPHRRVGGRGGGEMVRPHAAEGRRMGPGRRGGARGSARRRAGARHRRRRSRASRHRSRHGARAPPKLRPAGRGRLDAGAR